MITVDGYEYFELEVSIDGTEWVYVIAENGIPNRALRFLEASYDSREGDILVGRYAEFEMFFKARKDFFGG